MRKWYSWIHPILMTFSALDSKIPSVSLQTVGFFHMCHVTLVFSYFLLQLLEGCVRFGLETVIKNVSSMKGNVSYVCMRTNKSIRKYSSYNGLCARKNFFISWSRKVKTTTIVTFSNVLLQVELQSDSCISRCSEKHWN